MAHDFISLDYDNQSFSARIEDVEHAFSSVEAFFNLTKFPYKTGISAISLEPSRNIYTVVYTDGKQTHTEHSDEIQWLLNNWSKVKDAINEDAANTVYDVWTLTDERNMRLNSTDWLVSRHTEEKLLGMSPTLSESQFTNLLTYRQQLRDITNQYTTLDNVIWPVNPLP
jgi:hypothetical protein